MWRILSNLFWLMNSVSSSIWCSLKALVDPAGLSFSWLDGNQEIHDQLSDSDCSSNFEFPEQWMEACSQCLASTEGSRLRGPGVISKFIITDSQLYAVQFNIKFSIELNLNWEQLERVEAWDHECWRYIALRVSLSSQWGVQSWSLTGRWAQTLRGPE